ncbi:MAG: 50S ribosomal protein L7Ae-like protein [Firmicutes bacterium]|nr:50S ribosomal protein L7Ae-like protein [Bacillota bacterium]
MPSRLKKARRRVVGTNQTLRALENGSAMVVFVANDAESRVTAPVLELAERQAIEIVRVETMTDLGQHCGIDVGTACAALLKGSV